MVYLSGKLTPSVIEGRARLAGGGRQDPQVRANKENHEAHAGAIRQAYRSAHEYYSNVRTERAAEGLPDLPANTPFLLRIPEGTDPDFILNLGIEIVAETPEGVILVSTDDISAEKFQDKITRFEGLNYGGGSIAKVLEVISAESIEDRLSRILSEQLFSSFQEIADDQELVLDIGIECQGTIKLPAYPARGGEESEERYLAAC